MYAIFWSMKTDGRYGEVVGLLGSAQRVVGLDLVFKDRRGSPPSITEWTHHTTKPCRTMKEIGDETCTSFMFHNVFKTLPSRPAGRIHRCPHGLTEIVVPVIHLGVVEGFLFGGQCWMRKTKPPCDGLVVRPTKRWLEDRHRMLRCVAAEIARTVSHGEPRDPYAERIESFVQERFNERVAIRDLAKAIHLSPSRAAHVVKERFRVPFTELLNAHRLARSAEMLGATRLPVGTIAALVGFDDQGYFARLFRRKYRAAPRAWRHKRAAKRG